MSYVLVAILGIYLFLLLVVVPVGILWEKISWLHTVKNAWYLGGYK